MFYYTILYYAILYYTILYCTILDHIILLYFLYHTYRLEMGEGDASFLLPAAIICSSRPDIGDGSQN